MIPRFSARYTRRVARAPFILAGRLIHRISPRSFLSYGLGPGYIVSRRRVLSLATAVLSYRSRILSPGPSLPGSRRGIRPWCRPPCLSLSLLSLSSLRAPPFLSLSPSLRRLFLIRLAGNDGALVAKPLRLPRFSRPAYICATGRYKEETFRFIPRSRLFRTFPRREIHVPLARYRR